MNWYQRLVIGCVGLLLLAGAARSVYSINRVLPVSGGGGAMPVIVIDPGHGGIDGGAVAADGTVEKDINLAICLTMKDLFSACGFQVVMTRAADLSIHDEGITSVRKQKTSDLHNRLAIAQSHPDALFLSLHQNKFSDARSRGAQIFYGPNNPSSQRLAQILQENFSRDLQPDNKRQIKQAGKNLYLMYTAECPSVLVECGFLSNPEEARLLADPEYQAKIAFTIFRGAMEYLEMDMAPVPIERGEEPLPTTA